MTEKVENNNTIQKTAKRDLNFELLRVLSILSIVLGHLTVVGNNMANPLCSLGDVNCFVLISGYFMIQSQFKSQRFLRLVLETVFYCFTITLVFYITGGGNIGLADIAKSLIPFGPHAYSYWFINKFLALLLLQPFLSKLVQALSRRQFEVFLAVMYILNSELVMGFPLSAIFDNGWSLPWMITVFLTGGYIRLYNPLPNFRHWGWVWVFFAVVCFVCGQYKIRIFHLAYNHWFFMAKSVSMFMWIRMMTISPDSVVGRIIAFLSPNVLSVYLIHCQHLMMAWLLSTGCMLTAGHGTPVVFTLWCGYGICVILVCTLVDKGRSVFFDKLGVTAVVNQLGRKVDLKLSL